LENKCPEIGPEVRKSGRSIPYSAFVSGIACGKPPATEGFPGFSGFRALFTLRKQKHLLFYALGSFWHLSLNNLLVSSS
jgi:hypothetical protein